MKVLLPILLLFIQNIGFSQSTELVFLKGKVVCAIKDLNQINVFNLRSESSTNTNETGDYSMFVKVGDTLRFKSLQTETKDIVIQEADLAKKLLATSLIPKVIALEEVEIKEYKNINAVSLGIIDKPAKKYTPAERRLAAAEEFHWYSPLLIPLGGMSFDGLINSINGRAAMLKKELEVEKKELLRTKIENQFETNYFTEKLKIPEENVKGFLFYIVEDPKLMELINAKDKEMSKFRMSELATNYLALIKPEKE